MRKAITITNKNIDSIFKSVLKSLKKIDVYSVGICDKCKKSSAFCWWSNKKWCVNCLESHCKDVGANNNI